MAVIRFSIFKLHQLQRDRNRNSEGYSTACSEISRNYNITVILKEGAQGFLTIGWFWAVFRRDSGSCKLQKSKIYVGQVKTQAFMTNILHELTKQNAKINLKYGTLIRWNTAKLMIYENTYIREIPRENVLTCKVLMLLTHFLCC